jgi:two-component system, NarL family, nitrate/nitrite response regulator NarL
VTGSLRVLITDDHPVVRRGLRLMLEAEPWVERVVEASTVAEAVRAAVDAQVDVVAMDVMLPDGDGVDATRRILGIRPEVKVLMLTMTGDEDVVARALRAGARGFIVKDTDPDALVDALRLVAAGGVVLGPTVDLPRLGVPATARGWSRPLPPPLDRLTPREVDIVSLLAAGRTNADIGRQLGLNEKTVRNYLSGAFAKLGIGNRTEAALLAREAGLASRLESP